MRLILLLLFVINTSISFSQIYWDGEAGDGQWSSATNWVGNVVPVATDNVVLDNSYVTGTYAVLLPAGVITTTVNTLTITPATGQNITLTLPNTNTAATGLAITASGDAFVLNSGGIFRNMTGATSGGTTVNVSGSLRINNGGHYVHGTLRAHTGILNQLSTVSGTELGVFEFDFAGAGTISLSGRTFGTLMLSGTAALPVARVYTASGANPVNVRGDLIINTNTTLGISFTDIGTLTINRNLNVASGGSFNLQTSTNHNIVNVNGNVNVSGILTKGVSTGTPTLVFTGNQPQNFSVTGVISNQVIVNIDKSDNHVTLTSPVIIPFELHLNSGNIISSTANLLTINNGANAYNFSSSSFVAGPMKKIGNNAFIFPVGKGEILSPIHIPGGGTVTDEFTAEYHRINPDNTISNIFEPSINHISYVEHWTLDMPTSTAPRANVTLQVNEFSFARNSATLLVAQNDEIGNIWQNRGYAGGVLSTLGSGYVTGTYSSSATSLASSPLDRGRYFTLATTDVFAMNPLPVKLISFTAKKNSQDAVQLSWRLAEQLKNNKMVSLQKATKPNGPFVTITQKNMENDVYATYLDEGVTQTAYYRLAFKNEDGSTVYSNTLTVGATQPLEIVKVYPTLNPVNYVFIASHATTDMQITWTIYNMTGSAIVTSKENLVKGINQSQLRVDGLPKGVYVLKGVTSAGNALTYKIVK